MEFYPSTKRILRLHNTLQAAEWACGRGCEDTSRVRDGDVCWGKVVSVGYNDEKFTVYSDMGAYSLTFSDVTIIKARQENSNPTDYLTHSDREIRYYKD
jgi:hypothetical protein